MKLAYIPIVLAVMLPGCAVVPVYDRPYGEYSATSPYDYPEVVAPGYAVPAYPYGWPIYVGPPVRFSFGLHYWSGRGGAFRGHRHGFGHWGQGGFRGRGWRR